MHRFRRPINFVLTLALLLASTLGMMHGSLHAPGLQHFETALEQHSSGGAALADGSAASADPTGPSHGWLLKLFDHQEGQQCRLYDQLSGGCAPLGVPMVAVAIALPTATLPYFMGQAPAWPPALFEARGPPSNH